MAGGVRGRGGRWQGSERRGKLVFMPLLSSTGDAPFDRRSAALVMNGVRGAISQHSLIERNDLVLVACSGGADSVALVVVLDRLAREGGFDIAVASVDHGLRPEAAAEVDGVRVLCGRLRRPFYAEQVCLHRGGNLQARARSARRDVLGKRAELLGAAAIALGHTRDDQAETVLSRLLRGAGVRGLAAMSPKKGLWIRPLLGMRRQALRAFLTLEKVEWIEDPSNVDSQFQRVRLRRCLQWAETEDAAAVDHLAALADDARACQRALAKQVDREPALERGELEALRCSEEAVRREALRRWVHRFTHQEAKRAHLEALERLVLGAAKTARKSEVRIGPHGVRVVGQQLELVVPQAPTRSMHTRPRRGRREETGHPEG